jgi:hypothetical protein
MAIIAPLPNNIVDGQDIDAPPVMANFNQIVANVNANAAANGVNADITALNAITTPLPIGAFNAPQAFTPLDASGAGLTFTGVNCQYMELAGLVFFWGQFTFPVTSSAASAIITLPVPVPNHTYAVTPGAMLSGTPTSALLTPRPNTSTAYFAGNPGGTAATNAQLSPAFIEFMLIYPSM